MKDIIKSTMLGAFAFAILMTLFLVYYSGENILQTFVFSFLGFGIPVFLFSMFMSKKNDKIVKEIDGEVCYHCLANHFLWIEGVGGHLFITNDKIIFKSHSLNIQNHTMEIMLKDVVEVKTYNNLWIIPNGLEIVQKEKTDKFVVNSRSKIVKILHDLIS